MITLAHAWLQKHPSPAASGGEFHWYPPEGDRDLRASCVERVRGVDPPAVLWELSPGRVVWARPFAAIAPTDNRRYTGLVLTVAECDGAQPADLLDALVAPSAVPWTATVPLPERRSPVAPTGAFDRAGALDARGTTGWSPDVGVAAVVRALLDGGLARVGDPAHEGLPAWLASIERWMPAAVTARTRRGTWAAGSAGVTQGPDRVAELVAAAWRDPASSAARAWRLLVELAEAREQTIDDLAVELAALEDASRHALTDEERSVLPGKRALVDVLHAWGRGQLDQCPTAGTLTTRLADAVALRILAQLVAGRDARSVIAEARWYALLPSARRATLLEAVASRATSLRALVEVSHA